MRGARRPRRTLLLATLVSLGAHLIVLALLVPDSPVRRAPQEAVFEVELLPPPKAEPAPKENARSSTFAPNSARTPIRSEPPAAATAPTEGLANLHQPPAIPGAPLPAEQRGGGQALGLDGCD